MSGAFGSYLVVNCVGRRRRHPAWYGVLVVLLLGLVSGARGRRGRRLGAGTGGLPTAATTRCSQAGVPDQCDRGVVLPLPARRQAVQPADQQHLPDVLRHEQARSFSIGGVNITVMQVIIIGLRHGDDGLPGPAGVRHQARPQHPRRRRGRAHRGPDGHRHRQDHLAHVHHRRRPGRRGRVPVRHGVRASPTPWASSPGVKAFAAAVLGGIGNIRGAMLGGLLLGVVEALVPTAPWCRLDRRSSGPTWSPSWCWCWSWSSGRTGILGERLGRAA